jgi:hypothetical protein
MLGEIRCRVCGLRHDEAIWDEDGQTPTFATCACCGCTFGREDRTPEEIRAHRDRWRLHGEAWFDESKKPEGWRIEEQILFIPRFTFRVLPGLQGAGPGPVSFTFAGSARQHAEGFVVEFMRITGGSWVGNFQRGIGTKSAAMPEPLRTDRAIVIAGGTGYLVELESRALVRTFGGAINDVLYLPSHEALIFGNGLWFECANPDGLRWKTQRISWDGMQGVRLEGERILGEAFDTAKGQWLPFDVDVVTGDVVGGADPPS